MRRIAAVAALVIAMLAAPAFAVTYDVNDDANLRATVLFIGDSNTTFGAAQITGALTTRSNGYLPVFTSRNRSGIRGFWAAGDSSNYWQIRLAHVLAVVQPDAIVIDLGVNDAIAAGTVTTAGYSYYGTKINWLLNQLPQVPVLWSNLPCALEPSARLTGCNAVNTALGQAPSRYPNLTMLKWQKAASGHPEYMGTAPHYSEAGYTAWSTLVVNTLDSKFP